MAVNTENYPIPITEIEQSAFCQTDEKLTSKSLEEEFNAGVRWQKLPVSYMRKTPDELDNNIRRARDILGSKVVILGHHYQRDEVIKYADIRGDSYKLSEYAASQENVDHIVFCGVHFMAETADILSSPKQTVILPNLTAGCSMADMAQTDDVLDCWEDLNEIISNETVIPITYMNSTADIKSLCGENGGIVCTSSNAEKAFEWAFERGSKVLFLPDQHLGRNTGVQMGIDTDEMVVWNPFKLNGGHDENDLRKAKVILWQGHCSVHTRFTVEQIEQARKTNKDVEVIVHPECTLDVVKSADHVGSTEFIKKMIADSEPNSTWAIGTEISLVNRLSKENPNKKIFCLDSVVCPCSTMYRIHPAYLSWVLDGLVEGVVVNQIKVDENTRKYSRIALERMLSLG